ncbi:hypothetical protein HC024_20965 [Methylococcaceae bacterium WWC4]|nr:hypothetical protein [Methylococcaceae bacterium WWC4]
MSINIPGAARRPIITGAPYMERKANIFAASEDANNIKKNVPTNAVSASRMKKYDTTIKVDTVFPNFGTIEKSREIIQIASLLITSAIVNHNIVETNSCHK